MEIARAALGAMLDRLGSPAFVVDLRGNTWEASTSGRSLLRYRTQEVGEALRAAIAGRPSPLDFELIALTEFGVPDAWIAILRTPDAEAATYLLRALQRAVVRWRLTPRQTQVLDLVLRGVANATIAATFDVSERAVEQHITALFDKVGVDSRTTLVAAVLTQHG